MFSASFSAFAQDHKKELVGRSSALRNSQHIFSKKFMFQTEVFKGVNKQVDKGSPVHIVLHQVVELSNAVFFRNFGISEKIYRNEKGKDDKDLGLLNSFLHFKR